MGLLEGKSAVITGSSRGIGKAVAATFAAHGASLVIHGTNEDSLRALRNSFRFEGQTLGLDIRCEYVAGDIGDIVRKVRAEVAAQLGEGRNAGC